MSEMTATSPKSATPLKGRKAFKTAEAWLPKDSAAAARAVSRHGRDIENTTLYLLSSAFNSYAWDKEAGVSRIRPEADRPPGSAEALAAFRSRIATLNADRAKKAAEPRKPGEKEKKLTLVPELGEAVEKLARILLDLTLIERVVKSHPDALALDKQPAFSRLPQKITRGFMKRAVQGWSNYLAAVKAWGKAGGCAGRPCPPSYRPPGTLPPIDIEVVQEILPALGKKPRLLFSDEKKTAPLTGPEIAGWDGVKLGSLIREALRGRWGSGPNGKKRQGGKGKRPASWLVAPEFSQVKSLRIMIQGKRARLLIAVEVDAEPPKGSFFDKLAALYPAEWAELSVSGKEKVFSAWMARLAAAQDWREPAAFVAGEAGPEKNGPGKTAIPAGFCAMGVDVGVSNIAALACSDGSKPIVLSGGAVDKRLHAIDKATDGLVSKLTTAEHKALDAKKSAAEAAGTPFSREDARRRKALSIELHQSPKMVKRRLFRARVVKDLAHQTAALIAAIASQRRSAFVIVGKNEGWKDGSDLGLEQNRRFHRIPHGLIITLLREKLALLGIHLIETEESWTSRASFADHHELVRPPEPIEPKPAGEAETPCEGRPVKKQTAALFTAPEAFLRGPLQCEQALAQKGLKKQGNEREESKKKMKSKGAKPARAASRGEGKERNWLFRRGPWPAAADSGEPSRRKVHADVNGAYNMIRKICPKFRWHKGLSLRHELWGLTEARGLSPPRRDPQTGASFALVVSLSRALETRGCGGFVKRPYPTFTSTTSS